MIARLPLTREIQIQCIQLIGEGFPRLIASKMVLVHKDMQISTLEDIQKLKAKDSKEILRSKFQNDGWNKSGLAVKILRNTHAKRIPLAANQQQNANNSAQNDQDTRSDLKYDETLRRISALGWSTDLQQLPELYFIQLYDYLVVSTRKCQHIVLKGTNYKKLKSYQFLFEGNVKRLESKTYENKMYVKASVLPSMKRCLKELSLSSHLSVMFYGELVHVLLLLVCMVRESATMLEVCYLP